MTQFEQSGLKGKVKLYTVYTLDQIALPTLQKSNTVGALGSVLTDYWYPDLDNPENKRFVTDFRQKYGRDPSNYAAAAYDAIQLIKSAAEKLNGDFSNKAALRQALEAAAISNRCAAGSFSARTICRSTISMPSRSCERKDGKWKWVPPASFWSGDKILMQPIARWLQPTDASQA